MSRYNEKEKRTLIIYIFIFFLLAAGISFSGYISYHNFKQQFRVQAGHQLSSIAELKVKNLVNWRRERLADANMLYQNHAFATLVQAYFENPNNLEAQAQLQDWLKNYQENNSEYSQVRLMDAKGEVQLSFPIGLKSISSDVARYIPEVLQSKQVTLFDFYRTDTNQNIRLSLLVPIMDAQTREQIIGLVAISIDPQIYLYPFIEEWPIDSTSAETLLIRREANDAVFLNNLRFDPEAALTLHFPLTNTELPAVKAVFGKTGIVQGMDYRGKEVLADVRAVLGSPWFLVSKMDVAEVDAPLTARLWQTFLLAGMAILAMGAGLMTVWRQQRLQFYRTQADAAEAVRESEKKYHALVENMQVGVVVHAPDTKILLSNPMASQLLGLTSDQMQGKTAIDPAWTFIREDSSRCPLEEYPVNRALASKAPISNLVLGILRPDRESPTWVQCDAHQDHDSNGALQQIVVTFFDITERKQIQDLLRVSEEKYRILTDRIADQFFGMDTSLRYTYWNKTSEKETGIASEDALGKPLQEVFPDTAGSPIEKFFLDVLRTQESAVFITEYSILGRKKFFEITCYPSPEGLSVFSKDITIPKQSEDELRKIERAKTELLEKLNEAQYFASIGSWEWNLQTNLVWWSDQTYRIFGVTLQNFIPSFEAIKKYVHPDDLEGYNQALERSLQKSEPYEFDVRLILEDGTEKYTLSKGKVIFDDFGKPNRFIGTIMDVTERKQAEEALRESEDKFKYVFDNSVVGKSITLPSGEINVNKAFCEMLGYSREELINRKWQEISHPDDIELTQNIVNSLISGERESARFTKRYIHKNGSVIWTDIGTAVRREKDGKALYFMTSVFDITERKIMENALRESEDKWRSLVNTTPDFIALHDQEGRFQFLNHYAEGFSEKDVIGNSVYEYILPESVELFHDSFEKALHRGSTQHIEHKAMGDHGTVKTYEDYLVPVRGNGQEINIMVVSRDISERKQMEEDLRASELRFRSAAENLIDIVYEWDLKDKVDWFGDIDGLMGFPNGEFPRTMSGWADIVHPSDRSVVLAAVDAQLKHAIPYIVEYRVRKLNDSWRWWSARGSVLRDEHGQPTRWIGSITDITERKRAADALQRSERKYRQLHESMMDGFVSVDMNGNFLECNEVYRNMLGYTEAELSHLTYLELTPEKWHEYENEIVQGQIMRRGYSDIYEKEYLHKDGTIFPVELHTVLSRDEYGKPANMWAIVRDITERKRAEQRLADYAGHLEKEVNERTHELLEAQEQLVRQEKLATLGQLAGSMGHELRNPLGIISNAIYFLKAAQPHASDKVKEYLNIIEKEARTSDKIITDLLDFTRLKSVERQAVSVSDIIQQTLDRFPAPESVDVALNLPSDLPLIFADPHHVVQILGNLTVNAYQAVESNGGRVEITASSRADMVSIAIHDNGMGIAPENMNKLFEPLFTTKIKGIGLGLAVSKKLTEANSGSIEVESEAGVGSTFTIWLPVHNVTASDSKAVSL